MTISSVRHAEKTIARAIATGPMGTSDRPVVDCLLRGRPSSQQERGFCFTAIDSLEKRQVIYVTRDAATGTPITAEEYDCSKAADTALVAELQSIKPTLHITELLVQLHELLKREAGEKGRIHNGLQAEQYVEKLHAELSKEFDVSYAQVNEAFNLLSPLGLRGNAKSLRGVGMEVSERTLRLGAEDCEAEVVELRRETTRLEAENAGLLEENAVLTETNNRLEQSAGDLRQRNDTLALFRMKVQMALEESDKS